MSETRIFEVDDGYHWVIAADEADAIAIWRTTDGAGSESLDDEVPSVRALTRAEAERVDFWEDDPGNVVGTMWSEYERDPSRRYVGGSEY
jgi:hypothetical protein